MVTSRRDFIKNTALLAAGTALLPDDIFAAPKKIERLGLQLYSVRDAMKKNPEETLRKLYDMGYRHVEHAGYADRKFYGYSVKDFKKLLNDINIQMQSGHLRMTPQHWDNAKGDFTDEWKYTIEDAAEVGQRYVISPWFDGSLAKNISVLKSFMNQFNKCGELCKAHGLTFGYHNENVEFTTMAGDIKLYDFILKNTDPGLVTMQMDIGNMYGSGGVAIDYIERYPGRFELMHVKDEMKSAGKGDIGDGYDSTILGTGLLPVKDILKVARKKGGTSQFVIEQESYAGKDPLDCVKIDLQIMQKWGY